MVGTVSEVVFIRVVVLAAVFVLVDVASASVVGVGSIAVEAH